MFVHLFPYDKFTKNFIEFINKNFKREDHLFVLYGNYQLQDEDYACYENIVDYNTANDISLVLNNADGIVMHSCNLPLSLLLKINKWSYIKKSAWVIWGADLYRLINFSDLNFRQKLTYPLRYHIVKKCRAIVVLSKGDYDIAKENLGVRGKGFFVAYGNGRVVDLLKKIEKTLNNSPKATTKIIVGNSATRSNQHFEVFNLLKQYKSKNITVFCPLSYGDEEYRNEVIKEGERIFSSKFKPILDFIPYDEYLKLLSQMDVAVFNNNQQQALGNIRALLYFGCKVYLRQDTSMGKEFFGKFDVFSVADIRDVKFEEFKSISKISKIKNKMSILEVYDEKRISKDWCEIFEYLSNKEGR